jgi:phosphoribosyl-AMP cyclohydrolase
MVVCLAALLLFGQDPMQNLVDQLNFQDGLIPAVIVNDDDGQVLTLCYMDEAALRESIESGYVHVFRRSKGRLMKKGETSGHVQEVREVRVDCAENSLVIKVRQHVAGCHKGYMTCYYRRYNVGEDALNIVEEKVFDPDEVY